MTELATQLATRPEQRGSLEVRSPAVAHTIEQVVLELGPVVSRSSRLGSGYPRVSVRLNGAWAAAEVDVAVVWPCSVALVAEEVRRAVVERTGPLTGVPVRSADVTVHVVAPSADDARPRRVR